MPIRIKHLSTLQARDYHDAGLTEEEAAEFMPNIREPSVANYKAPKQVTAREPSTRQYKPAPIGRGTIIVGTGNLGQWNSLRTATEAQREFFDEFSKYIHRTEILKNQLHTTLAGDAARFTDLRAQAKSASQMAEITSSEKARLQTVITRYNAAMESRNKDLENFLNQFKQKHSALVEALHHIQDDSVIYAPNVTNIEQAVKLREILRQLGVVKDRRWTYHEAALATLEKWDRHARMLPVANPQKLEPMLDAVIAKAKKRINEHQFDVKRMENQIPIALEEIQQAIADKKEAALAVARNKLKKQVTILQNAERRIRELQQGVAWYEDLKATGDIPGATASGRLRILLNMYEKTHNAAGIEALNKQIEKETEKYSDLLERNQILDPDLQKYKSLRAARKDFRQREKLEVANALSTGQWRDTRGPGDVTVLYGPYKDIALRDVPIDWLIWVTTGALITPKARQQKWSKRDLELPVPIVRTETKQARYAHGQLPKFVRRYLNSSHGRARLATFYQEQIGWSPEDTGTNAGSLTPREDLSKRINEGRRKVTKADLEAMNRQLAADYAVWEKRRKYHDVYVTNFYKSLDYWLGKPNVSAGRARDLAKLAATKAYQGVLKEQGIDDYSVLYRRYLDSGMAPERAKDEAKRAARDGVSGWRVPAAFQSDLGQNEQGEVEETRTRKQREREREAQERSDQANYFRRLFTTGNRAQEEIMNVISPIPEGRSYRNPTEQRDAEILYHSLRARYDPGWVPSEQWRMMGYSTITGEQAEETAAIGAHIRLREFTSEAEKARTRAELEDIIRRFVAMFHLRDVEAVEDYEEADLAAVPRQLETEIPFLQMAHNRFAELLQMLGAKDVMVSQQTHSFDPSRESSGFGKALDRRAMMQYGDPESYPDIEDYPYPEVKRGTPRTAEQEMRAAAYGDSPASEQDLDTYAETSEAVERRSREISYKRMHGEDIRAELSSTAASDLEAASEGQEAQFEDSVVEGTFEAEANRPEGYSPGDEDNPLSYEGPGRRFRNPLADKLPPPPTDK